MESFAGAELQVHPKTYFCLPQSIWWVLVPAWAIRRLVGLPGSLRLQNPSLTSDWPKHKPGVTPVYTSWVCSSDDEAEKHIWRLERGRCLCCLQHVRSMKQVQELGWPNALSPPCVHTGPVVESVPGGVCQRGRVLLFLRWGPLSSCPTWKGWVLGLTIQPPVASCEASRTPIKLHPRRTPGTTENLRAQMETTRNVHFFLDVYIFQGYLGILLKKHQSGTRKSVAERNETPLY